MNDTTLPIVKLRYTKRQEHGSTTANTSESTTHLAAESGSNARQLPATQQSAATAKPSDAAKLLARLELQQLPRKAGARRGFGLNDWILLTRASKDLAQRRGMPLRKNIPMHEVQQHASVHDGWVVLYGKVYNLSPYLPYHPGGEAILKGILGKDGTSLFEKYHRWVNTDRLIGCLLLGTVSKSRHGDDDDEHDEIAAHLVSNYLPPTEGGPAGAMELMPPPPLVPIPRRPAAAATTPVRIVSTSLLGHSKNDDQQDDNFNSNIDEAAEDVNPWES